MCVSDRMFVMGSWRVIAAQSCGVKCVRKVCSWYNYAPNIPDLKGSTMSKGTYSFTTPIYYVNAAPHLGTAYTTVAADTVARYQRMNGYDVAFVTGMDEHGQKVADTAASHDLTPQAWCDSMEPAFRDAENDIERSVPTRL